MLQQVVSLPQEPNTVALFLVFLHRRGLKPTTIACYLSAIGYVHKLAGVPDPTQSAIVQKALTSLHYKHGTLDTRSPVTLNILQRLKDALNTASFPLFERAFMLAVMTVAFYGLFRIGELLVSVGGILANSRVIQLEDVKFACNNMTISIRYYKHNIQGILASIPIAVQQAPNPCPVQSLQAFIKLRGNKPGPLFAFPSGVGIKRDYFDSRLKTLASLCHLNDSVFKGHSFRIGGATLAAAKGFSDAQIRALGRWRSDAFKKYIRPSNL